MGTITAIISVDNERLTVGELGNFSSPRAISYSRIKCIRKLFVERIKNSLRRKY